MVRVLETMNSVIFFGHAKVVLVLRFTSSLTSMACTHSLND
jgi:hypothetical protein